MVRTQRLFISATHENYKVIDDLAFKAKNIYNAANYVLRQAFIGKEKMPSAFDLMKVFGKENQLDYRALPAQTNQQVIIGLWNNWKSFFALVKTHKEMKPKIPKYLDKVRGRYVLTFTKQNSRNKGGYIHFPKMTGLLPIRCDVREYKQVRFVRTNSGYWMEVVYEKEVERGFEENGNYLGIDLGINNLATCINSLGGQPLIINGKTVKSLNRYYNKRKAQLQGSLPKGQFRSKRLGRLEDKRTNKVNDYFHKASRFIIRYCLDNDIRNIVIGYNTDWKREVNMGKVNNQKFVFVPHRRFIDMITYKAKEWGIKVILHEESYTSKVDHLAVEEMRHHESYLGRRVHRGLFRSSTGVCLNADVNGAIGILRKVVGDGVIALAGRGCWERPIRITL